MGRGGALLGRALTMRCTITPRAVGAVNADNRPVVAYGTPVTGVHCRLMEKAEMIVAGPAQAGTVDYDKKLLVPASTVVQPLDQVGAVARPDPTNPASFIVFDAGPYIVRSVLDRADARVQFKAVLLVRAGG